MTCSNLCLSRFSYNSKILTPYPTSAEKCCSTNKYWTRFSINAYKDKHSRLLLIGLYYIKKFSEIKRSEQCFNTTTVTYNRNKITEPISLTYYECKLQLQIVNNTLPLKRFQTVINFVLYNKTSFLVQIKFITED